MHSKNIPFYERSQQPCQYSIESLPLEDGDGGRASPKLVRSRSKIVRSKIMRWLAICPSRNPFHEPQNRQAKQVDVIDWPN